jgi:hypothetical protein
VHKTVTENNFSYAHVLCVDFSPSTTADKIVSIACIKDGVAVANMESEKALEVANMIGKCYVQENQTSIKFLKTVAGMIVVHGKDARNNMLLQLRFILMTESLHENVRNFINDLCDMLDTYLANEVLTEKCKIDEALENARKAYYDAVSSNSDAETASLNAEARKIKAQKEVDSLQHSFCLLL